MRVTSPPYTHRYSRLGAACFGLLLSIMLVMGAHPAAAQTSFTVNVVADAPDANIGDGLCRTAAGKCSLRAAIQEANANPDTTTITLKDKTYKITLTGVGEDAAATGDFDITSPVIINGVSPAKTMINANYLDRAFHLHANGLLTLSKLTVLNGFSEQQGGGLYAYDGAGVVLSQVILRGNTAETYGGAVALDDGTTLQADSLQVIGNLSMRGGGIFAEGVTPLNISNGLFDDNSAEVGGALHLHSSTVTLINTDFEDNSADCYLSDPCDPMLMEGGALYAGDYDPASGGSLTFNQVIFTRNSSLGWSGGFSIYNATLNIENMTVYSNSSPRGGGGGYTFGADGYLSASAFIQNISSGSGSSGGGVYFQNSLGLAVSTTTFSNNGAASGGGVYVTMNEGAENGHSLSLEHVTIANNYATDGGGLWVLSDNGGLTITGSILDENTASSLGPDCGGASIPFTDSLISDDTHCTITGTGNQVNVSAGLGDLSYGVNGLTLAHVPMMASPVLDAEAACTISFDQHGNFTTQGQPCTIGAVSGTYVNLLSNESFESGVSGWKVASPDKKDKVVSNTAYTGSRAFAFTGVSGKTASIRQRVTSGILGAMTSGQTVCASAMFYTKSTGGKNLTIQIVVKYSDGDSDTSKQAVILTAQTYEMSCSGLVVLDLTGRAVSLIEARIISKSKNGKVFVDNVSASWDASVILRDANTRGAVPLDLPAAPSGFRGGN